MPGLKLPKQPDLLGQQSKEKRDGEKQRIHDSYDLAVSVVIGEEAAKTRTLAGPPNKQDANLRAAQAPAKSAPVTCDDPAKFPPNRTTKSRDSLAKVSVFF